VHVLVRLDRCEGAVGDLGRELGQRTDHPVELVAGEQPGPVQHPGVRP
jgi:hypothetical protein